MPSSHMRVLARFRYEPIEMRTAVLPYAAGSVK